jgi:hypothetical protein
MNQIFLRIARFAGLVVLAVLAVTGCASLPEREPLVEDPGSHPWREDLARFAEQLERRHADLFFQLPRDEFAAMIRDLDIAAPTLTAAEFELELRRILTAIGDSHTTMSYGVGTVYPLSFYQFSDGIYCVAAGQEYQDALAARLVAIDGTPVAEVIEAAREMTPHDNESQIALSAPMYLMMPELLAAAGITRRDDEGTFSFRDEQGDAFSVTVSAVPREEVSGMVSLASRLDGIAEGRGEEPPLARRGGDRFYWYTSDRERDLLYVQYNVCREDPEYGMDRFAADVMASIRRDDPAVVLIDLRRNGGGDSRVLEPLIAALAADADHRGYRLTVAIGRRTFSSAVLNAIDLRQKAGADFVGEPSGGRPNHYGEVRSFELPNLDRTVQYSTRYFESFRPGPGEDPDPLALFPDTPAPRSFGAYLQGRDPVIEAVTAGEGPTVTRVW